MDIESLWLNTRVCMILLQEIRLKLIDHQEMARFVHKGSFWEIFKIQSMFECLHVFDMCYGGY